MRLPLKKTHTLIDSCISSMIATINQIKPKYQGLLLLLCLIFLAKPVHAIVDPLSVPNNRFGIHIIGATPDESSPAAQLVNTNGDWGYVTVLVESKDRNHEKWQEFFNDLRRKHLIPLVRLATQPDPPAGGWKRPYEGEEVAWADFLDALNWPTKNRYIIIYNEPNHATEWGNAVDAKFYSETLDKTITALKNKNRDFFVLNGGFDASAPNQLPRYQDELSFINQMEEAVPGIFDKLDGWVSHSYPNPEFAGSPDAIGRGTVRTYSWELNILRNLGLNKRLPVFITETGWKHAEGINLQSAWPGADTVAEYYKNAFEYAWNNNMIVAVTPFLLNYQEAPFDHFSFKKLTGDQQNQKILGAMSSPYYSMYQTIQNLPKISGRPVQEIKAKLIEGEVYTSIVSGENYTISLTFKNTGQSIWNDREQVKLVPVAGGSALGITVANLPKEQKVEPEQEYTFKINLKAPQSGTYNVSLNLFEGNREFEEEAVKFTTQVKSPVILVVLGALGWKKNFEGSYVLKVKGVSGDSAQSITLDKSGLSSKIEARYLLPDYAFDFSLERPFYSPKTLHQKVSAGVNTLDFGTLNPDILSLILNPRELLKHFGGGP